jgi:hypothetical protein
MEEILKYTQFINEKKSSAGKKVLFVSFRKSEKKSLARVD